RPCAGPGAPGRLRVLGQRALRAPGRAKRRSGAPGPAHGSLGCALAPGHYPDNDRLAGAHPLGVRPEEAEPGDPVLAVVFRSHARRDGGVADELGAPHEVRSLTRADPDEQGASARDPPRLVTLGTGGEVDRLAVEHEPNRDDGAGRAVLPPRPDVY